MEATPFYRLKDLLLQKYGEKNFTTGCALAAWWISYETGANRTAAWITETCNVVGTPARAFTITVEQAKALKSLFKLQSVSELYTLPETMPKSFHS